MENSVDTFAAKNQRYGLEISTDLEREEGTADLQADGDSEGGVATKHMSAHERRQHKKKVDCQCHC